jgi:mRNA interferase RelE/StbE
VKYQVILSRPAERELAHLPKESQSRVIPVLRSLADNPRPAGIVAVTQIPGAYRIRVGNIRVVYTVRDNALIVLVLAIADRKEVYDTKEIARIRQTLRAWLEAEQSR